jgi:hypothetical protein
LRLAARQLQLRGAHDVGGSDRDELDLPPSVGVAVAFLVRMVETVREVASERNRQLERLSSVPEVSLALPRQVIDLAERPDVRDDAVAALVPGGKA